VSGVRRSRLAPLDKLLLTVRVKLDLPRVEPQQPSASLVIGQRELLRQVDPPGPGGQCGAESQSV
jgi:hypothetical protein